MLEELILLFCSQPTLTACFGDISLEVDAIFSQKVFTKEV
jgi:hypothetical protein